MALENAVSIIEELSADWDPESYTDCYRERLRKVIDRKRKRQTIEAPKAEREPPPVPDLMEALQRTLQNVRDGDDPRAGHDGSGEEGDTRTSAGSVATSCTPEPNAKTFPAGPRCRRSSSSRPCPEIDDSLRGVL